MVGVEMLDEVRNEGGWRDAKGANHFSGENALVISRPTFSRPHSTLQTTTILYLNHLLCGQDDLSGLNLLLSNISFLIYCSLSSLTSGRVILPQNNFSNEVFETRFPMV
jgi:hypothetical protein